MDALTLRRPDDWHLHLRDGAMLAAVLPATAAVMGRAIVMPNLVPPVVTTSQAAAYRARILALLPPGSRFQPLMTAYLTEDSDPDDLAAGHRDGVLTAVKLYPAGATTNSHAGVRDLSRVRRVLERLEALGMPLLVHGEVTTPEVDIFDREAVFLDTVLSPLLAEHTALRVVFEHATTAEAVAFVRAHRDRVGCTVTPQHLLANRNDMLVGGVRPHFYCLPVLKRARHQQALVQAVTSGEPSFFLGTDSAPHPVSAKESACGCAGCYTAPVALQLYAEVFDAHGALEKLEGFASLHGPAFYGLPVNPDRIRLVRGQDVVPSAVAVEGPAAELRPFLAGRALAWRVQAEG
ncbi:dihydroorotase [Myxococcota bacterium]|nr:dihydroorotase [Myxococcota bacterium]